MFNDPEISKLIIFALIGMVAVLTIAVIVLAVKKNTYYVDEEGNEIEPVSKEQAQRQMQQVKQENVDTIVTAPLQTPLQQPEVDPIESKLESSLYVKSANPKGLLLTIVIHDQKQHVRISQFPTLIGRDSNSCQLVVNESAVSRRHARFIIEEGKVYLEDVSEHNGTYINGAKLPPLGKGEIRDEDKISLGRAEIFVDKVVYE